MNILIVNHYATSPKYSGGTRHYDFAKELISCGHHVTIIASSFNHSTKKETKTYHKKKYHQENIDGINFIWIKTLPYINNIKRILNIISFYKNGRNIINEKNIFPSPDIVIGSTVHLLASQLGLDISKRYNAKFIFEERDFWPQTFVDFNKMSNKNIIAKFLYKYEKYFYKKASNIIVLFPKAAEYVISRGVDNSKIIYLPNGYSTKIERAALDSEELRELVSNNDSITYIGSHGIANELDAILNLAIECKRMDLKFIFIGEGNEKNRMIKKAEKEKLNNVYFFDSINKNQVQEVLYHSKFTVISIKDSPLYKYGFSMNKMYDYFLSGKPIQMIVPYHLASSYDTLGVTVSSDLIVHKKALDKYIKDEEYYLKSCRNVREFGKQYNWSLLTEQFLKKL